VKFTACTPMSSSMACALPPHAAHKWCQADVPLLWTPSPCDVVAVRDPWATQAVDTACPETLGLVTKDIFDVPPGPPCDTDGVCAPSGTPVQQVKHCTAALGAKRVRSAAPRSRLLRNVPGIFSRAVTCEMRLRMLNIPKAMHECLGLGDAYPVVNGRRSNQCDIYIRSPDGVRHLVLMLCAAGSHHRRLTRGWRSFCWHTRLRIGDTVRFRRTDVPGELDTDITRGS
jgi:hypothetical protein